MLEVKGYISDDMRFHLMSGHSGQVDPKNTPAKNIFAIMKDCRAAGIRRIVLGVNRGSSVTGKRPNALELQPRPNKMETRGLTNMERNEMRRALHGAQFLVTVDD